MSTSEIRKEGASKSSDDGVCEMNDMLQNMSTADKDASVCANCGKEGDDINNICNKCKLVKYCNAACKKKHRHKHKKECGEHLRLAAERAAELHEKSSSNNLHQHMEIVQFVSYGYQGWNLGAHIRHAAEKLFVVGVVMHQSMITKAIKLLVKHVLFAELQHLNQMRKQ